MESGSSETDVGAGCPGRKGPAPTEIDARAGGAGWRPAPIAEPDLRSVRYRGEEAQLHWKSMVELWANGVGIQLPFLSWIIPVLFHRLHRDLVVESRPALEYEPDPLCFVHRNGRSSFAENR